MRISVLTGVLACTLVLAMSNRQVGASTSSTLKLKDSGVEVALLSQKIESDGIIDSDDYNSSNVDSSENIESKASQEIKHTIEKSENLSTIAKKYKTTWKRIFDKNTNIENPDVINPGEEIIIPNQDEQLTERSLPAPIPALIPRQTTTKGITTPPTQNTRTTSRGSSSGNLYVAGYCTWYVKNMRPDLPNNLGNAYSWYSRAAAQGMAVGSTPRAGAVGQRGNHVVYVQSVNTDGTVTISEMNHKGLYVQTVRTLPANYFRYIY